MDSDDYILRHLNSRRQQQSRSLRAQSAASKRWQTAFFTSKKPSDHLQAQRSGMQWSAIAEDDPKDQKPATPKGMQWSAISKLLKLSTQDELGDGQNRDEQPSTPTGVPDMPAGGSSSGKGKSSKKSRAGKTPRTRKRTKEPLLFSPFYETWHKVPRDDHPPHRPDERTLKIYGPHGVKSLSLESAYIPHKEPGPQADRITAVEDLHRHSARVQRELDRKRAGDGQAELLKPRIPSTDKAVLLHGPKVRHSVVHHRRYYTGDRDRSAPPVPAEVLRDSPHCDRAIQAWLSQVPAVAPGSRQLNRALADQDFRNMPKSRKSISSDQDGKGRGGLDGADRGRGQGSISSRPQTAPGPRGVSNGPNRPQSPREHRWIARKTQEISGSKRGELDNGYSSATRATQNTGAGLPQSTEKPVHSDQRKVQQDDSCRSNTPRERTSSTAPSDSLSQLAKDLPLHVLEARVRERRGLLATRNQAALVRRNHEEASPRPPFPRWQRP